MLKNSMLGFDISATDIRIKTESKKIDENNTKIDFPLMVAKNVKMSNGLLINLAYNDIDMILSMLFIIQIQTNSHPLQQLTFLRQTAHFSELLRATFV
jgi:hypothetical protein